MDKNEILIRCLDNTAPPERYEDLGVLVFARTFFPEVFDSQFARMHYDIIMELLDLYHPKRTKRTERQKYINIHREAAKTTIASFLFPLYNIFLKGYTSYVRFDDGVHQITVGERFIVICSETATAAENFTTNIRTVIETRTDLIPYFGDKHPQLLQIDDDETTRKNDKLWRKNAFITQDGTIVFGIGSGQQIRGKNVLNSRPTLIIVDDMYSENSVLTEHSRKKLDKWFFAGLVNSGDSIKCKIMWLGTLVHLDTVITKMKKNTAWEGVSIPIISITELDMVLKTHCKFLADEVIIPSKEECRAIQRTLTSLSWPQRHDLHYILSLYAECYVNNNLAYFYQEYINTPAPPEEMSFPDEKFKYVQMYYARMVNPTTGLNELCLYFEDKGTKWFASPVFDIGVDMASGESEKSDDTAIGAVCICSFLGIVPGVNTVRRMTAPVVFHVEGGKYGVYEEEGAYRTKPGIVTAVENLSTKVPLKVVRMEVNGQQGLIAREARRTLRNKKDVKGNAIRVVDSVSYGKKEERIRAVLEPIFQKYPFILINALSPLTRKFQSQLQSLGHSDHEDYADCVAIGFSEAKHQKLPPPPRKQQADERLSHYPDRQHQAKAYDWETL